MGEETHEGAERSPAELERAGRAALGRPVTARATAGRIEKETTERVMSEVAAKQASNGNRSADDIEADIEKARTQLAATLDEIVDRVKPANVARRTADQVRGQFIDADTGQPRLDRIVPVVGGVFGIVALVVVLKRRGRSKD